MRSGLIAPRRSRHLVFCWSALMSAGEPLQQGGWPARDYRTRKKGTPPGRWRSHLSFATIVHPILASSLQRSGSMQKSPADRSGCRIHPDAASRKPARICETPGLSKRLTTPVVRRSPLPDCAERGHRRGRAGDRFGPAGRAEAGHCFGDEPRVRIRPDGRAADDRNRVNWERLRPRVPQPVNVRARRAAAGIGRAAAVNELMSEALTQLANKHARKS
jgi:hypothetical protein